MERTGIDFLVENFKEYVELRDKLMVRPYCMSQIPASLCPHSTDTSFS